MPHCIEEKDGHNTGNQDTCTQFVVQTKALLDSFLLSQKGDRTKVEMSQTSWIQDFLTFIQSESECAYCGKTKEKNEEAIQNLDLVESRLCMRCTSGFSCCSACDEELCDYCKHMTEKDD